ncbi:eCIS core domain-containing protein [Nostoc sp. ChiVER01]|uniref:eCIS core domain-containing protein n=1 Tax=Nostoc sp. ChiVER01 TaxID=3075382 RepID=UPI002AD500EE|nr:DUF4157 domain-containing protein [Nostoc sp. ChiVER01]MDZ8228313.1 DUF4157 domain-containing protein [Nostoc sp. ChiVER01]
MPEDKDDLQMQPIVQRVAEGSMAASADVEAGIQKARSSGQPLVESIREPMEQAFRADFSGVRVHTDSQADQLNQSIQAKAFTTGQDVFFRQGAYEPGSRGGQELLAHELTHVVQQNGGAVRRSHLPQQMLPQKTATETSSTSVGEGVIHEKGEMTGYIQESSEVLHPNKIGIPDQLKTGIENLSFESNNFSKAGTPTFQLRVLSFSASTIQAKWIDEDASPYYKWDKPLDGVQWYALKKDPNTMFFYPIDEKIKTETAKLSGPSQARRRSEWLEASGGEDTHAELDASIVKLLEENKMEIVDTMPMAKESLKIERLETGTVNLITSDANKQEIGSYTFKLDKPASDWRDYTKAAIIELSKNPLTSKWANRNALGYWFQKSKVLKVSASLNGTLFSTYQKKGPVPEPSPVTPLERALVESQEMHKEKIPNPKLRSEGKEAPKEEQSPITELYAILEHSNFLRFFEEIDTALNKEKSLSTFADECLKEIEVLLTDLLPMTELLNIPDVTKLWADERMKLSGTIHMEKQIKATDNWVELYQMINAHAAKSPKKLQLSVELIKSMHGQLVNGATKNGVEAGKTREKTVNVGKNTPVPSHFVDYELAKLVNWMNQQIEISYKKKSHIIPSCGIFLSKFLAVHPFDDGNGRTARGLIDLILEVFGLPPGLFEKTEINIALLTKHPDDIGSILEVYLESQKVDIHNEVALREWLSFPINIKNLLRNAPGLMKDTKLVTGKEKHEKEEREAKQFITMLTNNFKNGMKRAVEKARSLESQVRSLE